VHDRMLGVIQALKSFIQQMLAEIWPNAAGCGNTSRPSKATGWDQKSARGSTETSILPDSGAQNLAAEPKPEPKPRAER